MALRLPRLNRRSFLGSTVALAAAAMWLDAARRRFRGTVIVGRDLLEV